MTVKVFCLPLATFSPLGAKATMNSLEHVGSDKEVKRTNPLSAQPRATPLRPRTLSVGSQASLQSPCPGLS